VCILYHPLGGPGLSSASAELSVESVINSRIYTNYHPLCWPVERCHDTQYSPHPIAVVRRNGPNLSLQHSHSPLQNDFAVAVSPLCPRINGKDSRAAVTQDPCGLEQPSGQPSQVIEQSCGSRYG
jgi:hypothetical protein